MDFPKRGQGLPSIGHIAKKDDESYISGFIKRVQVSSSLEVKLDIPWVRSYNLYGSKSAKDPTDSSVQARLTKKKKIK